MTEIPLKVREGIMKCVKKSTYLKPRQMVAQTSRKFIVAPTETRIESYPWKLTGGKLSAQGYQEYSDRMDTKSGRVATLPSNSGMMETPL